ncbi:MAG: NmrA family NAD(P)-binding protein [Candidatus Promineifilaceae bacterium]
MILVTGAAGKTGRSIIQSLSTRHIPVRALIHHQNQAEAVLAAGTAEFIIGDMADPNTYQKAMSGISAVYFICPNVNPHELEFAAYAINAAKAATLPRLPHFVYHSVLHPQVEAMPHHWLKMRVEEQLFASGLPFTILQPAAYMQNILGSWPSITEQGIYPVPYSAESRHSIVDLNDVAQAAATVLLEPGHQNAIYELSGPQPLSQTEIAEMLTQKLKRPIMVHQTPIESWREQAQQNGLGRYQIETLIKMFNYYDQHGFQGSPNTLSWLLKRPPTSFAAFLERVIG